MPRLIRRVPLVERIKGYLDPADFLLWLSEELESRGWDQLEKEWAIPIGFGLNLFFLIARANSRGRTGGYDDVFGDSRSAAGWSSWLVSVIQENGPNHSADRFLFRLPFWSISLLSSRSSMPPTHSGEGDIIAYSKPRSMLSLARPLHIESASTRRPFRHPL